MGLLLISVFVVMSLSLLEFIDRSEWEELDEKNAIRLSSNRRYGAYKIRSQQSLTVVLIVGAVVLILSGYLGCRAIVYGRSDEAAKNELIEKASREVDTTQFAMSMDNQVEAPPEHFNHAGNNGDNMPRAQKGAQQVSDRPEKANDYIKPEPKKKLTPEEEIKAFERSLFDNAAGNAERKRIQEKADKEKKEREAKAKQKEQQGGDGGTSGTNASVKGNVSVIWKFSDNRDAFEGKEWLVPAPAYTCGNDVDAEVKVKVKVDLSGHVVSASIISSSIENSCIKNNALTYAKKARFEPSSIDMQEGTITYRYKAK